MQNTNYATNTTSGFFSKQLEVNLLDTISKSDVRPDTLELFSHEMVKEEPLKLTIKQPRTGADALVMPITYQRKQIGALSLSNLNRDPGGRLQVSRLAQKIAYMVSRHHVAALSEQHLGRKLTLSGQSSAILDVEKFIEKASCSTCPVMIVGEVGTDKLAVAIAIHFNRQFKQSGFVEIECEGLTTEQFKEQLLNATANLREGTLFLNGIDTLNNEQQATLLKTVGLHSYQAKNTSEPVAGRLTLIAASSVDPEKLVREHKLSMRLYEELNFLRLRMPSLRERTQDIATLIAIALNRFRLYEGQSLSMEVLDTLQNYDWPGNEAQLERALARLLTLSDSNPVNLKDLFEHLPKLFSEQPALHAPGYECKVNLTQHMLDKNLDLYSGMHSGVFKALRYISENYETEITLTDLAGKVFVSASHLSYLFKHHLKKSFKQILSELRIERAKQKIEESPYTRVTDIFQDVGFGDLSHFEKIFKRYTGVTPRDYKKKVQSAYSAQ